MTKIWFVISALLLSKATANPLETLKEGEANDHEVVLLNNSNVVDRSTSDENGIQRFKRGFKYHSIRNQIRGDEDENLGEDKGDGRKHFFKSNGTEFADDRSTYNISEEEALDIFRRIFNIGSRTFINQNPAIQDQINGDGVNLNMTNIYGRPDFFKSALARIIEKSDERIKNSAQIMKNVLQRVRDSFPENFSKDLAEVIGDIADNFHNIMESNFEVSSTQGRIRQKPKI